MIIKIGLLYKRPGYPFSLVMEDIFYDFIYIDCHAQCPSHPGIIERLSSHVVSDIGIT